MKLIEDYPKEQPPSFEWGGVEAIPEPMLPELLGVSYHQFTLILENLAEDFTEHSDYVLMNKWELDSLLNVYARYWLHRDDHCIIACYTKQAVASMLHYVLCYKLSTMFSPYEAVVEPILN